MGSQPLKTSTRPWWNDSTSTCSRGSNQQSSQECPPPVARATRKHNFTFSKSTNNTFNKKVWCDCDVIVISNFTFSVIFLCRLFRRNTAFFGILCRLTQLLNASRDPKTRTIPEVNGSRGSRGRCQQLKHFCHGAERWAVGRGRNDRVSGPGKDEPCSKGNSSIIIIIIIIIIIMVDFGLYSHWRPKVVQHLALWYSTSPKSRTLRERRWLQPTQIQSMTAKHLGTPVRSQIIPARSCKAK